MNPFVIPIPEIALAHQIDYSRMVVGKSEQFIAEKYCIRVIVQVEIVDGQLVQSFEALVS